MPRKILVGFDSKNDYEDFFYGFLNKKSDKIPENITKVTVDGSKKSITVPKKSPQKKNKPMKEWEYHWVDLPDFRLSDEGETFIDVEFIFSDDYTNEKLAEIFNQSMSNLTKSIYYPKREPSGIRRLRYSGTRGNPMYPIYVISKGRSERCITADYLLKMGVPFKIVIEKQEWEAYSKVYGDDQLLELDLSFRDEYDTYIENFDVSRSKGSGPARNFVWNHAKESGAKWHWIIDDNIFGFYYCLDGRKRILSSDGSIFATAEDFVNRYENIGIAGLNYFNFVVPGSKDKPYVSNTKIYSCILIRNDVPIRWAGRYNEDVDICIRALKEGYSTIQFDAFSADKAATQSMGGGNTEAFYAEEGTLPKSNMLMYNHPDITSVSFRFSRWHHQTNYDVFDHYKDRTIVETLRSLSREPLLRRGNPSDDLIIEEISKIDFSTIKRWNILKRVNPLKRDAILSVLKFYRYKKDTNFILNELTAEPILKCNISEYLLGGKIPDTEDNRIMKDCLSLGNERGILVNWVDFDSLFSYISDENKKRKLILELIRNKYLKTEYEEKEYHLHEVRLTENEQKNRHDSKNYILNKYINKDDSLPVITTLFDRNIRGEIKSERKKFKANIVKRSAEISKEHNGYTVMIHGSEDFTNDEVFLDRIEALINPKTEEIINSVYYQVDLMGANYALDKKLKSKDFVPDFNMYTTTAYREMYKLMVDYSDECVLFVKGTLTDDLKYLIELFHEKNKPVHIEYEQRTKSLFGVR